MLCLSLFFSSFSGDTPFLHLLSPVFDIRTPQTTQVPNQSQFGSPASEQVPLLLLLFGRQWNDFFSSLRGGGRQAIDETSSLRRRLGGSHALARPAEHLVHAGQDLFRGPGERQVQRGHVVAAQPARGGAQQRSSVAIVPVVHHLAHAHHHEGGKHVARAAKVALEHGEVNLE